MNDHDKLMLDITSKALQPQPSAVPVKQTNHKIRAGKRIRMLQAAPLKQYTHRDGTRHAFNSKGEQV